jgi:hypothetical protein
MTIATLNTAIELPTTTFNVLDIIHPKTKRAGDAVQSFLLKMRRWWF